MGHGAGADSTGIGHDPEERRPLQAERGVVLALTCPRRPCIERAMSAESQFALLRERRFLPYFLTQLAGALNDNVFRNGVAFLLAYQLALPREQELFYANLALALFILPFFLFSALAGSSPTNTRSRSSSGGSSSPRSRSWASRRSASSSARRAFSSP